MCCNFMANGVVYITRTSSGEHCNDHIYLHLWKRKLSEKDCFSDVPGRGAAEIHRTDLREAEGAQITVDIRII